jgi:hypothetical protein
MMRLTINILVCPFHIHEWWDNFYHLFINISDPHFALPCYLPFQSSLLMILVQFMIMAVSCEMKKLPSLAN